MDNQFEEDEHARSSRRAQKIEEMKREKERQMQQRERFRKYLPIIGGACYYRDRWIGNSSPWKEQTGTESGGSTGTDTGRCVSDRWQSDRRGQCGIYGCGRRAVI